jgi:hypothetical protein
MKTGRDDDGVCASKAKLDIFPVRNPRRAHRTVLQEAIKTTVQMDNDRNVPAWTPCRDEPCIRQMIRIMRDDQRRHACNSRISIFAYVIPQQRQPVKQRQVIDEIVLGISLVIRPRGENISSHAIALEVRSHRQAQFLDLRQR